MRHQPVSPAVPASNQEPPSPWYVIDPDVLDDMLADTIEATTQMEKRLRVERAEKEMEALMDLEPALLLRTPRVRFQLVMPEDQMEMLRRLTKATKADSITSLVRYAIFCLATLFDSREHHEDGWVLCWVKNGKARKINLPNWR
jgi:hypothetical protein